MDMTAKRTPAQARRLLEKHPNLYMSMKAPGSLSKTWRKKMDSRRCHIGLQSYRVGFAQNGGSSSSTIRIVSPSVGTIFQPTVGKNQFRRNLQPTLIMMRKPWLPPVVARKIAFENAQRLFKINVLKPEDYPLPKNVPPKMAGGGKGVENRVAARRWPRL